MSNTSIFWAYPDPNGPVRPSSTHFFQWNMNDNEYTYWRPHLVMWTIFRRDLKVLQSMAVTYIWDTNDIHWIIHNPVEHWKIYTHHQPVAGCWCNNHLVHTYTLKNVGNPFFTWIRSLSPRRLLKASSPPGNPRSLGSETRMPKRWRFTSVMVETYWNLTIRYYKYGILLDMSCSWYLTTATLAYLARRVEIIREKNGFAVGIYVVKPCKNNFWGFNIAGLVWHT